MSATTDGATRAAKQHQHRADDQHDDAYCPENANVENETEEQENKSENNHVQEIPLVKELQTPRRSQARRTLQALRTYNAYVGCINWLKIVEPRWAKNVEIVGEHFVAPRQQFSFVRDSGKGAPVS